MFERPVADIKGMNYITHDHFDNTCLLWLILWFSYTGQHMHRALRILVAAAATRASHPAAVLDQLSAYNIGIWLCGHQWDPVTTPIFPSSPPDGEGNTGLAVRACPHTQPIGLLHT